jgi:hypothetical protein
MSGDNRFRGKSTITNEWVYGILCSYGDGVFISSGKLLNNNGKDWKIKAEEVKPETIEEVNFTDTFGQRNLESVLSQATCNIEAFEESIEDLGGIKNTDPTFELGYVIRDLRELYIRLKEINEKKFI